MLTTASQNNGTRPSFDICLGKIDDFAKPSMDRRCLNAFGTAFTNPIVEFDVRTSFWRNKRRSTIQRHDKEGVTSIGYALPREAGLTPDTCYLFGMHCRPLGTWQSARGQAAQADCSALLQDG
jgi:hypothetical protein